MSEEVEKAVKMADDALEDFDTNADEASAKMALYRLTRLRIVFGDKFESLSYYALREAEILRYISETKINKGNKQ